MDGLAWRRTKGYLIDWLYYLGLAVLTIPLGLLALRTGWATNRVFDFFASFAPPLLAALLAAWWESRPDGATPGKRLQGLAVRDRGTAHGRLRGGESKVPGSADGRVSMPRAVGRNLVKIAVPWQLGHTQALAASWGAFDDPSPVTLVLSTVTWAVLGLTVFLVLRPNGLGLHDRIALTRVVSVR